MTETSNPTSENSTSSQGFSLQQFLRANPAIIFVGLALFVIFMAMTLGAIGGVTNHLIFAKTKWQGSIRLRVQKESLQGHKLPKINHRKAIAKRDLVNKACKDLESKHTLSKKQRRQLTKSLSAARYKDYKDEFLIKSIGDDRKTVEAFLDSLSKQYSAKLDEAYGIDELKRAYDESRIQWRKLDKKEHRLRYKIRDCKEVLSKKLFSPDAEQEKQNPFRTKLEPWRKWMLKQHTEMSRMKQRFKLMRESQNPGGIQFVVEMFRDLKLHVPERAENYFSAKYGRKHLQYVRDQVVATHSANAPLLKNIDQAAKELDAEDPGNAAAGEPIPMNEVLDELQGVVDDRLKLLHSNEVQSMHQQLVAAAKQDLDKVQKEYEVVCEEIKAVNKTVAKYHHASRQYIFYGLLAQETRRSIWVDIFIGAFLGMMFSVVGMGTIVVIRLSRMRSR